MRIGKNCSEFIKQFEKTKLKDLGSKESKLLKDCNDLNCDEIAKVVNTIIERVGDESKSGSGAPKKLVALLGEVRPLYEKKLVAVTELFTNNFPEFKKNISSINDKVMRVSILSICSKSKDVNKEQAKYLVGLAKNLSKEHPALMVDLILLYAEKDPVVVIKNLSSFGIKSEEARVQIAVQCAKKDPGAVIKSLSKFGIKSEEARVQIAVQCAKKDPGAVIKKLSEFGIESEKGLKIVALQLVEIDVPRFINNLALFKGIKNKLTWFEIALKCAEKEPLTLAYKIKEFGWLAVTKAESKKQLYEVALKCAESEISAVVSNFSSFEIESPEAKVQFAKKLSETVPGAIAVAKSIKTFKFSYDTAMKILKSSIQKMKESEEDKKAIAPLIFLYLEAYSYTGAHFFNGLEGFDSKKTRIDLALQCAETEPSLVIKHFSILGISTENDKIGFVYQLAEQAPDAVAQKIDKFNIKDMGALNKIMTRCSEVSGNSIYIEKFLIKSKVKVDESLIENAMRALKAANQKSASEKVDIPDLEGVEEVPYDAVREIFASFTDEDLTGIVALAYEGRDRGLTPEDHRENFDYFLDIVERNVAITGVNPRNIKEKYRPFKRLLKHIAKKNPGLSKEEQISYLSRFSILTAKTFCFDPYIKAAQYVYNGIKDEDAPSVSTQDPIKKLQEDLRGRLVVVRDAQLNLAVKHTHESPIDTHSRNWVQNVLSEVGYEHISDEEDMYLNHGADQLAKHLKIPARELVEYLTGQFRVGLVENCFEGFCKVLKNILEPQPSSVPVEAKKEEGKVTSATVSEYFHQLVDYDQAAAIKAEKEGLKNKGLVDSYVSLHIKMRTSQKQLQKLEGESQGLGENIKMMALMRAINDLEDDAKKQANKILREMRQEAPEDKKSRADDYVKKLPELEKEYLQRLKPGNATGSMGDLKQQQQGIENSVDKLRKKSSELEAKLAGAREALGDNKCKALDKIFQKSETVKKAWSEEWFSEEDVIDPKTGEGMLGADYIAVTRVKISFKGRWEFYNLFMDDEIRSV